MEERGPSVVLSAALQAKFVLALENLIFFLFHSSAFLFLAFLSVGDGDGDEQGRTGRGSCS